MAAITVRAPAGSSAPNGDVARPPRNRTREIGIPKAVGARKSDIVLQFLTEAVVLTVIGGIPALITGWMISFIARLVFPSLPTAFPPSPASRYRWA